MNRVAAFSTHRMDVTLCGGSCASVAPQLTLFVSRVPPRDEALFRESSALPERSALARQASIRRRWGYQTATDCGAGFVKPSGRILSSEGSSCLVHRCAETSFLTTTRRAHPAIE